MTTAPLRCSRTRFLHIQDGLLAKEDEQLPLTRHVVSALQHFHFVEDFVFIVFVRTKEVVVSDPEDKVIARTVDAVKTICVTVRSLIGAVQPLDHLFEWAVFRRNSVVVGKSNHLSDFEGKVFPELLYEFHCSEGIGTVAVSDELKILRQPCKSLERHTHGEDAGADTTVVRHLVADDGSGGGIHDEPDIGLDASDFDIGFIRCEDIPSFVGVQVNKGLDADSGGLTVVCNLLVGNTDVIQVFESLGGFTKGKPQVDMKSQAQRHDMGVMFTEFQGRSILWQGS